LLQFAPDVEHDGRRVDFPQWPRIRWRFLRDYGRSEIAHAFKLCSETDSGFPGRNLVCNLIADSFHLAKLAAFCREDLLLLTKILEKFALPHRPEGRHVCDRERRVRSREVLVLEQLSPTVV